MPTKENYIAFFLDFQKAFDSVWHNGLLYKLLDNKIAGKSYHFLADVYSRLKCPVKIGYKRTDCFTITKEYDKDVFFRHCYLTYRIMFTVGSVDRSIGG